MRRAAILILALGDELAREIFTRLSEEEIRHLGRTAARLDNVTQGEVVEVLKSFRESFRGESIPRDGAGTQFQLMVETALGEDRARDLLVDDVIQDPFDAFHDADAAVIAMVLSGEHPQTVAIVLAELEAAKTGEVLQRFDSDFVSDVVYRMAHLGNISDEVKRDIGKTLAEDLAALNVEGRVDEDEREQATVDVIKALPRPMSDEVFEAWEARDAEFAKELRGKIFTFDDLAALDGRSMQRLLREVDTKTLAPALRGASDEISELIFNSMSQRAAEMLRDDIDAMGPTRVADVEVAQKAIMQVAMKLEEDGVIAIPRGGDSGMV
jgi:flagellar motor switch protein FliG